MPPLRCILCCRSFFFSKKNFFFYSGGTRAVHGRCSGATRALLGLCSGASRALLGLCLALLGRYTRARYSTRALFGYSGAEDSARLLLLTRALLGLYAGRCSGSVDTRALMRLDKGFARAMVVLGRLSGRLRNFTRALRGRPRNFTRALRGLLLLLLLLFRMYASCSTKCLNH